MKRALLTLCLAFCAAALNAAQAITVNTEDDWQLAALYEPAAEENGKVVVLLHDLGKNKETYNTLAKKLQGGGFGYLALDLRGHGESAATQDYRSFNKTGTDNEFNQMVRDVTAATDYLNKRGVNNDSIYLLGAGLGANVAAKSLIFNPDIAGIALLTPSLKIRDVLTMSGIQINKNPVFIAVSSEDRKQMMEASFIRNAAFLASGRGKVTFMTAYNLKGIEMVEKYLAEELLQWLHTPQLPELKPDMSAFPGYTPQYGQNAQEGDDIIILGTPSALL